MMRRSFVAALVVLALPAVPFAADSISDLGFDEIMVKNAQQGLDKDPNVQLKRRLQAFLETTADVDFAAKTTGSGSMRRFADETNEAKPNEWKMCFRAGPEVTKAGRDFAEEWLSELP